MTHPNLVPCSGAPDTNAALRFYSDLRRANTTNRWTPHDLAIAVESHPYDEPSVPVHNAPQPNGWLRTKDGVVITFPDTSAVAFKRSAPGVLIGPHTTWSSPIWSQPEAKAILGPLWQEAPGPFPRDWTAPLTPLESQTAACPSQWAPPALLEQRIEAAQAARRLLIASDPENNQHWFEYDSKSFVRATPQGPLQTVRVLWIDTVWEYLHPGSFDRQQRMMAAVDLLFPGALGWASTWDQPSPGGPVVLRAESFLTLPPVREEPPSRHDTLRDCKRVFDASPQALAALRLDQDL